MHSQGETERSPGRGDPPPKPKEVVAKITLESRMLRMSLPGLVEEADTSDARPARR